MPLQRYAIKTINVLLSEGAIPLFYKICWALRGVASKIRNTFSISKCFYNTGDLPSKNNNRFDVILLATIDDSNMGSWRQYLNETFSINNHRIFIVTSDLKAHKKYSVRILSENIYVISLPASAIIADQYWLDEAFIKKYSALLFNLYNKFRIKESVVFVASPALNAIAGMLNNDYGAKIIYSCINGPLETRQHQIDTSILEEKMIQTTGSFAGYDHDKRHIVNIINCSYPLTSIIIVTYNNIQYTKYCLESVYAKTAYPNYELVIVDNCSEDGTREYIDKLKKTHNNIKIIFNDENLGFARANNMGIRLAEGDNIIFLNNDAIVTRGWISGLTKYLKDPETGMVGPVTNSIGNEARIWVDYNTIEEVDSFAERYTVKKKGKCFEIPVLAFFCAALSRQTIEKVGPLDEQFNIGMFEDDDYAMRVRRAGLKILCAEDVFIHHFGGASFKKLKDADYNKIFSENRFKYEQKWGVRWIPHRHRAF